MGPVVGHVLRRLSALPEPCTAFLSARKHSKSGDVSLPSLTVVGVELWIMRYLNTSCLVT
jgi:hypothetical protein